MEIQDYKYQRLAGEVVSLGPIDPLLLPFFSVDSRRNLWVAEAYRWRWICQPHWKISKSALLSHLENPPLKGPPLRPFQKLAMQAWIKSGGWGSVELPTGAGKTWLAIHIIAFMKRPTLILVPTIILMRQWQEELITHFGEDVGVLGDGERTLKKYTVSTYASATQFFKSHKDPFEFLVSDEAHHLMSGNLHQLPKMSAAIFRLSLSASFSLKLEGLPKQCLQPLGNIVYRIMPKELPKNILKPFVTKYHSVTMNDRFAQSFNELKPKLKSSFESIHQLKSKDKQGKIEIEHAEVIYRWKLLKQQVWLSEETLSACRSILNSRPRDTKTLIFCPDSITACYLSHALKIPAILAEISKSERMLWLSAFREGQISELITCKVLNEGFDLPAINRCILFGGSNQRVEFMQRLGRALRYEKGKQCEIHTILVQNLHSSFNQILDSKFLKSQYGTLHEATLFD